MITLEPIPVDDLMVLSKSCLPTRLAGCTLDGALPPAIVATRALQQISGGKSAAWCNNFYIRDADGAVIGGCGFKDEPCSGRVEIGYSVAPDRRNRGVATSAIEILARLAFKSAEVYEVLAKVNELNGPSTRVVQKLGFTKLGTEVNGGNEVLVQWILRADPAEQNHLRKAIVGAE